MVEADRRMARQEVAQVQAGQGNHHAPVRRREAL